MNRPADKPGSGAKLVVIGGGFAGLWATRALAKAPLDITLIDRANHHLFQPLLYQVATAGLSAPDIAAPLRQILRDQANVRVLLAEVSGIDLPQKSVTLQGGQQLPYDQLLVASGATYSYFGHDEWAPHAPGLKTLDDALLIRRRVLLAFERAEAATTEEEQQAWLHFAVVGGGPTGVELAGTLAEIARHTLRQEFRRIDPRRAQVRLIEAGPALLASFPPRLQQRTRTQLERLGVEVQCGTPVADITATGYRLGDRVESCRTVLWAAGVAASSAARSAPAPLPADMLLPDDFDPFAPLAPVAAPVAAAPSAPEPIGRGVFDDLIPSAAPVSIDQVFGLQTGERDPRAAKKGSPPPGARCRRMTRWRCSASCCRPALRSRRRLPTTCPSCTPRSFPRPCARHRS